HFGHALADIIHHRGKLIGYDTIGAPHHEIADARCQILLIASLYAVCDNERRILDPHTQRAWRLARRQAIATRAGVDPSLDPHRAGAGLTATAATSEQAIAPAQTCQCLLMRCPALALIHDGAVPVQAEDFHR